MITDIGIKSFLPNNLKLISAIQPNINANRDVRFSPASKVINVSKKILNKIFFF